MGRTGTFSKPGERGGRDAGRSLVLAAGNAAGPRNRQQLAGIAQFPGDGSAYVRTNEYSKDEREEAIRAYEEVERAIRHFPGAETVLVRVGSVDTLRRAYPNCFADTSAFVAELRKVIG